MASIGKDGDTKRLQFTGLDGNRKTVRLGKITARAAAEVKRRVELLLEARRAGLAVDGETADWMARLPDELFNRLAACGLAERRNGSGRLTIAEAVELFLRSKTEAKPQTLVSRRTNFNRLIKFFGAGRTVGSVKDDQATEFSHGLKADLAESTRAKTVKDCRELFAWLAERGDVAKSPFRTVKGGSERGKQKPYVTPETIARLLDSVASSEWRLLIGMARWMGIRAASEMRGMTWEHVLWDSKQVRILSPKTEHHDGKGERVCPMFEAEPLLRERFDAARPGETFVFPRLRLLKGITARLTKMILAAGLTPWTAPWNSLRSSCETDLFDHFPGHVVTTWLGNSERIARKHYLQVTADHLNRAALVNRTATASSPITGETVSELSRAEGAKVADPARPTPRNPAAKRGKESGEKAGAESVSPGAVQNPPPYTTVQARTETQKNRNPLRGSGLVLEVTGDYETVRSGYDDPDGIGPHFPNSLTCNALPELAILPGAESASPDPQLSEIISRWDELPESVRAAVLSLVRSAPSLVVSGRIVP